MSVEEFGRVYQSVERIRARDHMLQLSLTQNAFHGDKKSFKSLVDRLKEWLPRQERNAGKGNAEQLANMLQRK